MDKKTPGHADELNHEVQNIARGGGRYRKSRERIFAALQKGKNTPINLSDFLARELFSIPKSTWTNIDFTKTDKTIIPKLSGLINTEGEKNYLLLATRYVEVNCRDVKELYDIRMRLEGHLATFDVPSMAKELAEFSVTGQQSLFFLRTYVALHSNLRGQAEEAIKRGRYSAFVRDWLVYPLTYWMANAPSDAQLDYHLSYIVPISTKNRVEREIIRFILDEDVFSKQSLVWKSYLGLLVHPYDCREILISHIEQKICTGVELEEHEKRALVALHRVTPCSRSTAAMGRAMRQPLAYRETISDMSLFNAVTVAPAVKEAFVDLFNPQPLKLAEEDKGKLLPLLQHLRLLRYPEAYEYQEVTAFMRRYWFLDIARLVKAFMGSLYLTVRRDEAWEVRDIYRLETLLGCGCLFTYTAPRGLRALGGTYARPIAATGTLVSSAIISAQLTKYALQDRWWLKSTQWKLKEPQSKMKVNDWLSIIREKIPITLDYLSGVSWHWVEEVIRRLRILPFRGNPNGIYVLLLHMVETRSEDSNRLRIALEPVAANAGSFEKFTEQLYRWYGEDVLAFLRYFLTPNNIMLLRFSDTYIGAGYLRIRAIERFVKVRRNNKYFTPTQLQQEQRAFSTELLLINVSASQFEITWDVFKKDIQQKFDDLYEAFVAFQGRDRAESMSEAKAEAPFTFCTGRDFTAHVRFKDLPLINMIFAIIDGFLQHPSQGIESILSVRIRHHNFMRQFTEQFEEARSRGGGDFAYLAHRGYLEEFERAAQAAVQVWLDQYIHQTRPGRPDGAFDFIPSNADVPVLLSMPTESFGSVIEGTTAWIKRRLEVSLQTVRLKLNVELKESISAAMRETANALAAERHGYEHYFESVSGQLTAAFHERIDALNAWFQNNIMGDSIPADASSVLMLMTGVYRNDIEQKRLRIHVNSILSINYRVERAKVRQIFDICCELINNALRYGRNSKAIIRIVPYSDSAESGLIFMSLCGAGDPMDKNLSGSPLSAGEGMFVEGNSGLEKVAALSASVAEGEVNISVVRRRGSYRVKVPFVVQCEGELWK